METKITAMKKNFGTILEALMHDKRLSVRELAQELEVPAKTVQEWMGATGRMPRQPENIKKVAEYFGISIHYLLFGTEEPRSLLGELLEKTEIHTGLYEITVKKVKPKMGSEEKL